MRIAAFTSSLCMISADMKEAASSDSTDVLSNSTNEEAQDNFRELFSERVRAQAEARGLRSSSLGALLGLSTSSASNYWNGVRAWPAELLSSLASALDTTVGALFYFGDDAPVANDPADLNLVAVNEIDMAYGLGGTFTDGPIETKIRHFGRDWLRSITLTPPNLLTWTRGRGDSMGATIQDDDLVLIDRSQQTVREQDAIWAFTIGEIGSIKRLRIRGGQVTILSDNERVPDDTAGPDEINIVGRVVFIGRKI